MSDQFYVLFDNFIKEFGDNGIDFPEDKFIIISNIKYEQYKLQWKEKLNLEHPKKDKKLKIPLFHISFILSFLIGFPMLIWRIIKDQIPMFYIICIAFSMNITAVVRDLFQVWSEIKSLKNKIKL
jgi:hypothetical protein